METDLEAVRIKKVGVLSVANISALIMAVFGFVMGSVFSVMSFFYDPAIVFGIDFLTSWISYSAFIIFTIVYWILGFIFGAIAAFLYNVFAKLTKGIVLYA